MTVRTASLLERRGFEPAVRFQIFSLRDPRRSPRFSQWYPHRSARDNCSLTGLFRQKLRSVWPANLPDESAAGPRLSDSSANSERRNVSTGDAPRVLQSGPRVWMRTSGPASAGAASLGSIDTDSEHSPETLVRTHDSEITTSRERTGRRRHWLRCYMILVPRRKDLRIPVALKNSTLIL
jgi:hypothetical protein